MKEKIRVQQVLVVEGKYDAAVLCTVVDALVLTTDGFGIFKDKQMQCLLKDLGRKRGVIVLTDPDAAGFRIRNFVANIVGEKYVQHAYVPAIKGKESRKEEPGKEGLLGVEGIPAEILRSCIIDAGITETAARSGREITYADLFLLGLSGTQGSREHRYTLLRELGLPPRLSKRALLQVLNSLYTYEEVQQVAASIK